MMMSSKAKRNEVGRLERERDDARAAEAEMRQSLDVPEGQRLHYGIRQVQEATKEAVRERDEARAEVERLREALGKITRHPGGAASIARDALHSDGS